MALMTARPWKHPATGAYFIRQRTPLDLLPRLKGQPVSLPVGEQSVTVKVGEVVQASLRTKDASEARSRHAIADGALKRFWEAQRKGPTSLTLRQITALSGVVYRSFTGMLSDDPGPTSIYETLPVIHAKARAAGKLDQWLGPTVDQLLRDEGLVVDEVSRAKLIEAVDHAYVQAAAQLKRHSEGDFRPDPDATRFGEWKPLAPLPAPVDRITVADLFERWAAFSADKKAPNTIKRYRGTFQSLIRFAKDRDIRSLTGDDLFAWAEHRRDAEGVTPQAINKNDLVAVSSVCGWAATRDGNRLLTESPVKGIRLVEPRKAVQREKTFREAEIGAILGAALAVKPDEKNPTFANACRWCPWLAAYTGARIAELTHLEQRDIRTEAGVVVMDLRVTKTGEPRTVPVHDHLIEQGFLEFVKASGAGPLFYDPSRHGKASATSPAELRGHKVGKWVRETVKLDLAVNPNHGWRHTWKTKALEAGIEERLRDAVTGHRVSSVGRTYETPSLKMLAEAMKRFPRYESA